ncbi:hypothetical protein OG562_21925 [Streptomyces sp. NBC_01275]|uniref:DUF7144 family membrane protein n=1 Tax=Streptomyces sp. NBC_01275 TaxID=2903807 RepID=UPI00225C0DE8|nr:hypothetical protein [Streptomyces sp. NBC_01275]MCX4763571.1 hypothetical protein [Streptomyces sp. NBC_01275]
MSGQPQSHSSPRSPVWDPSHQGTGTLPPTHGGLAGGGVVFAGVLMLVNGVLAVLQGISAIAEDDVYADLGDYVYKINLTGWGWLLLSVGVVTAVVGGSILRGAEWARLTGILLASLNLILQFLFLQYAPIWSIILIATDVFVIWALAAYRPPVSS